MPEPPQPPALHIQAMTKCCEVMCLPYPPGTSPQAFLVCPSSVHGCPCLRPSPLFCTASSPSSEALLLTLTPSAPNPSVISPHISFQGFLTLPPLSGVETVPEPCLTHDRGFREGRRSRVMSGYQSNQRGCVHRRAGAMWLGRKSES